MANVSSNTWGQSDIEEAEVGDERVVLEQEGELWWEAKVRREIC